MMFLVVVKSLVHNAALAAVCQGRSKLSATRGECQRSPKVI